jgi:hypothetical protein
MLQQRLSSSDCRRSFNESTSTIQRVWEELLPLRRVRVVWDYRRRDFMRWVSVMTTRLVGQSVVLVILLMCSGISSTPALTGAQSRHDVTDEIVEDWMMEPFEWGAMGF